MGEQYQPLFELWKTNHGVDGWDAKTWLVATFSSRAKALNYLATRGYTHQMPGGTYWCTDERYRHCMGAISYEIRSTQLDVPHDPQT